MIHRRHYRLEDMGSIDDSDIADTEDDALSKLNLYFIFSVHQHESKREQEFPFSPTVFKCLICRVKCADR